MFSAQEANVSCVRNFAVEPKCSDRHRGADVQGFSRQLVFSSNLNTQQRQSQGSQNGISPLSLTYRVLTAAAESCFQNAFELLLAFLISSEV